MEVQLLKDSLGSQEYKTQVHQLIINGLLKCNPVNVNGHHLNNLLDYFRWKSTSDDKDMKVVNYKRLLRNFDFSQFSSLLVEDDFPNLIFNFYDELDEICTIEFTLSEAHSFPLNKKITLESFYFDGSGGVHFDRINKKLIERKPVVYINGVVYAVVFLKDGNGVRIY